MVRASATQPSAHGTPQGMSRRRRRSVRSAFTLIETSLALIIIGVGVLAFVDAQQGFTRNNSWSSQAATATLLANEVRELTRHCTRHDPVTSIWLESSAGAPVVRGWGPEAGETTADSFDDLDDFDGRVFGATGDMDGPVNAFGEIIPGVDPDGNVLKDKDNNVIPLAGWTQKVKVEKVDPFDWTLVRPNGYEQAASGSYIGRKVDQFPLRITVTVLYQGPLDPQATEITKLIWVVPN